MQYNGVVVIDITSLIDGLMVGLDSQAKKISDEDFRLLTQHEPICQELAASRPALAGASRIR